MKLTFLTTLLFLFVQIATAQKPQIDADSIPIFFEEIKAVTKKNTTLWNKDLYGPILLVNPQTRALFANESDTAGILTAKGDSYFGMLPNKINVANTAINWGGKRWAMIMLPLPQKYEDRINLLAHELFHTAQPALGFKLHNPENNHLDQKVGRVYLRLELEALKKAVQSSSTKELQQHLTNALIFRKYRHLSCAGSAETENLLELNEGISEFTGVILSGRTKQKAPEHLSSGIDAFLTNPTFVRSFAYQTIPTYGYLLYHKNKNWNKEIKPNTDLTNYFVKAFQVKIPNELKETVAQLSQIYNGELITLEETAREVKTQKLIAEYKLKFVEQPHFEIQFEKMNVSFDPRNVMPLEDKGTVYPSISVTDTWGILKVANGALMSANWRKIAITNPTKIEERTITGDGWTLELNPSYALTKDEKSGNYQLTKK